MNTIETYADGGADSEFFTNAWTMLGFDFDNGTNAQDFFGFYDTDVETVHLGLGYYEAATSNGDSGSGAFIEDPDNQGTYLLTGVVSAGVRLDGDPNSDIDDILNSSFGELGLLANVPGLSGWITANVPEPSAYALIFGGLALVAAILRRRRRS